MNRLISRLIFKQQLRNYSSFDNNLHLDEVNNIIIQQKYQSIILQINNIHHKYNTKFIDMIPCIIYHISMDLPDDIRSLYYSNKYYKQIDYIIINNYKLTNNIRKIVTLILNKPYIGSNNVLQLYLYLINLK
jgi:hypothetical protein